MSYEKAREALEGLYESFDRGLFFDSLPLTKTKKAVREGVADLVLDDLLTKDRRETQKVIRIFALVEALREFSYQIFGNSCENFFDTYGKLRILYLKGGLESKRILDNFIKKSDFLEVFEKKLSVYSGLKDSH
jgi:hypothetical protein